MLRNNITKHYPLQKNVMRSELQFRGKIRKFISVWIIYLKSFVACNQFSFQRKDNFCYNGCRGSLLSYSYQDSLMPEYVFGISTQDFVAGKNRRQDSKIQSLLGKEVNF